ncbi:MAG: hypothetical protein Q9195_006845 [Heterodermia aff. obscurata]
MSANGSHGVEDWSQHLPETHKQQGFLAFAFRFIFYTGPDNRRGLKVANLVNDKFPDCEPFLWDAALSSHRHMGKNKNWDWEQWQILGTHDEKVTHAMRKNKINDWLEAQKGENRWKDLRDADEALSLMMFARCWIFNSQTERNVKEEFKKIAEMVNELGPTSDYTPETAEKEFNSWQDATENHPQPNWSKMSSESQEVCDFRQKYEIDERLDRKGYK